MAAPAATMNAAGDAAAAAAAAPPSTVPTFAFSIGELSRGGAQLTSLCADLASINACAYCMLRFINVKQEKAYQQTKEWLQSYTTHKLGWSLRWSDSGCPLCVDLLSGARLYWSNVIEPALRDEEGNWRYELDTFSLSISEPVLTRIRQYAANQVFRAKYSRLQSGYVDIKEAIKWQTSALIVSGTGGTAKFVSSACDFGFLLTYTTEVPDQEYALVVATLPLKEHAAARRAPGDYTIPSSNNPSTRESKGPQGRFKKRGKKNPRADTMGQKTVVDALPRIKTELWEKLDVFEPVRRRQAEAVAAAAAATAAASDAAAAPAAAAPAAATTDAAAVVPAAAALAAAAATATTTPSSSSSSSTPMDTSAPAPLRPGIHVPSDYPLPLTCLVPPPTLLLTVHREPVLLCGNYRKFYRALSQSVWKVGDRKVPGLGSKDAGESASSAAAAGASPTAAAAASTNNDEEYEEDEEEFDDDDEDGGDDDDDGRRRMTDSSVEEEITRMMLSHFEAREYKFHSSGREDMDVRMLGNGRMFFIEFIEAKRVHKGADFYSALQSSINASSPYIEVLNLHLSSKAEFNLMKKQVSLKRKKYRCVVWIEQALLGPHDPRLQKLNDIKDMLVQQRTPIRVLHRRSLLVRPKHIYSARAEYINAHWIYLDVVTSAGTYVKEFVHGDRARTVPSVGTIVGCRTEIIQLDVIGFDSADADKA